MATGNVLASVHATSPFMRDFAQRRGGMDAVFCEFSLDSDEAVAIQKACTATRPAQPGFVPDDPGR